MPTSNPRLTITLTPEIAAVLQAMSEATGDSQSAIVGGLLEVSRPVFERVVQAAKAARVMEESAKTEIAAGLERAQKRLEAQLPFQLAELDEGFRPLLEHAEKVLRRRAGAAEPTQSGGSAGTGRGASTPVPVTRGSGGVGGVKSGGSKRARKGRAWEHVRTWEDVNRLSPEEFAAYEAHRATQRGKKRGRV